MTTSPGSPVSGPLRSADSSCTSRCRLRCGTAGTRSRSNQQAGASEADGVRERAAPRAGRAPIGHGSDGQRLGSTAPRRCPRFPTKPAATASNEPLHWSCPARPSRSEQGQARSRPACTTPPESDLRRRRCQDRVANPAEPARRRQEAFEPIAENPFIRRSPEPLSTFSIDVDTASYANVRRFLAQRTAAAARRRADRGDAQLLPLRRPAAAAGKPRPVRRPRRGRRLPLERRAPAGADRHRRASRSTSNERPPSNLVFLIDVSGSMDEPNKLPLVKGSLQQLVEQLGENDRVAIVVYAGASGVVPALDLLHPAQGRDPLDDRPASGRRLDQRRRGHPARLRHAAAELHQGRHQPRHPGHRRRLQRRRSPSATSWSS